MATPENYLSLTEKQKEFVRENSTRLTVESMVAQLYTSRQEVMKFIMTEKLSMKIVKKRKEAVQ